MERIQLPITECHIISVCVTVWSVTGESQCNKENKENILSQLSQVSWTNS